MAAQGVHSAPMVSADSQAYKLRTRASPADLRGLRPSVQAMEPQPAPESVRQLQGLCRPARLAVCSRSPEVAEAREPERWPKAWEPIRFPATVPGQERSAALESLQPVPHSTVRYAQPCIRARNIQRKLPAVPAPFPVARPSSASPRCRVAAPQTPALRPLRNTVPCTAY